MMRRLWLAKAAAVALALCLTAGVMSQTVLAGDDGARQEEYLAALPEATFVVLDGGTSDKVEDALEVTDNRLSVPLYLDGAETPVASCSIRSGVPYIGVAAFCGALGLTAQTSVSGDSLTLGLDGLLLTAKTGEDYFVCNDRYFYVDGGVRQEGGQIVLPVEDLVKCLGVIVTWDRVQWRMTVLSTALSPLESGDVYYDANDLYWLSRLINAEAGGQPLEAQVAVGDVCLNRLDNEDFGRPDTVYGVIFAKNQFDVVANGMIYMEPDDTAILAAKLALEGCDLTDGATYVSASDLGAGYECVALLGELYFLTAV